MAEIDNNQENNIIAFEDNLSQTYANITEEAKNKVVELLNEFKNLYEQFKAQYDNAENILNEARLNVEQKVTDVCKTSKQDCLTYKNEAKEWATAGYRIEYDDNKDEWLYSAKYYAIALKEANQSLAYVEQKLKELNGIEE